VAISCTLFTSGTGSGSSGCGQQVAASQEVVPLVAPEMAADTDDRNSRDSSGHMEDDEDEGAAAFPGAPRPAHGAVTGTQAPAAAGGQSLVFLLHPAAAEHCREAVERSVPQGGAGGVGSRVRLFGTEEQLLLSFLATLRAADPDILVLFQVRNMHAAPGTALCYASGWKCPAVQCGRWARHACPDITFAAAGLDWLACRAQETPACFCLIGGHMRHNEWFLSV